MDKKDVKFVNVHYEERIQRAKDEFKQSLDSVSHKFECSDKSLDMYDELNCGMNFAWNVALTKVIPRANQNKDFDRLYREFQEGMNSAYKLIGDAAWERLNAEIRNEWELVCAARTQWAASKIPEKQIKAFPPLTFRQITKHYYAQVERNEQIAMLDSEEMSMWVYNNYGFKPPLNELEKWYDRYYSQALSSRQTANRFRIVAESDPNRIVSLVSNKLYIFYKKIEFTDEKKGESVREVGM